MAVGILSPHGVLLRRELCWWAFWPEQRWGLRKSEGKDPAVGGQWRKTGLFNKYRWENWMVICKTMRLEHALTPYKNKLKMD